MYASPEKFAAANKANVDAAMSFAQTQFAALERFTELNMTASKTAFEEIAEHFKSLSGAKDPQDIFKLNTAFAQPSIEKGVAYGKHVYDITTQAQAAVTAIAETQAAEANKAFASLLDTAAKNSPAGSDPVVTAIKTTMAAFNSAYDNFSKVAKQAAEVVEVNVAAATQKPRRKAA
jgi:phasin family protein